MSRSVNESTTYSSSRRELIGQVMRRSRSPGRYSRTSASSVPSPWRAERCVPWMPSGRRTPAPPAIGWLVGRTRTRPRTTSFSACQAPDGSLATARPTPRSWLPQRRSSMPTVACPASTAAPLAGWRRVSGCPGQASATSASAPSIPACTGIVVFSVADVVTAGSTQRASGEGLFTSARTACTMKGSASTSSRGADATTASRHSPTAMPDEVTSVAVGVNRARSSDWLIGGRRGRGRSAAPLRRRARR